MIALMFSDISERVRAEEELIRYRDNLAELVQEKTEQLRDAQEELIRKERLAAMGKLTAAVSHEIRNPLGTVRTSVFSIGDALKRNEMERVGKALKLAERNIVRCDGIIRNLLDYTRIRELYLKSTNIDEWLAELLDEYPVPEGVECVRELNSGVKISIDREQLRRAIINVINNAVQALDEEGLDEKKLTVVTGVSGKNIEIRIADTGPGIPDELYGKVFEPLFSNKSFGVGMGLAIVKNIMEQHGGGVEIERLGAGRGSGATVILRFPLDEDRWNRGKAARN